MVYVCVLFIILFCKLCVMVVDKGDLVIEVVTLYDKRLIKLLYLLLFAVMKYDTYYVSCLYRQVAITLPWAFEGRTKIVWSLCNILMIRCTDLNSFWMFSWADKVRYFLWLLRCDRGLIAVILNAHIGYPLRSSPVGSPWCIRMTYILHSKAGRNIQGNWCR